MEKLIYYLLFIVSLPSCLSPKEVSQGTDPDLQALQMLIVAQKEEIMGYRLEKQVKNAKGAEQKTFEIDSVFFDRDFEILDGKDLNQVFLSLSYEKSETKTQVEFVRKPNEEKGPLYLKIEKSPEGFIRSFSLLVEDDNVLFRSGISTRYEFDESQKLSRYVIVGSQKMTGMEPATYEISGEVTAEKTNNVNP